MKQTANRWLSQMAGRPGLLAGAILYPDQTLFCQSWSADYPVASLETACRRIAGFIVHLHRQRLPEQRLFWFFESGCIGFMRRTEGATLFCWSIRFDLSEPPSELRALLDEFAAINLSGESSV